MSRVHSSVVFLWVLLAGCRADLYSELKLKLNYFEVMHPSDVRASSLRSKRSASHLGISSGGIQEVKFSTLGRSFHLYMTHDREIFAPGFEAVAVDAQGVSSPIFIDTDSFLVGHVAGENSSASLRWEGDAVNAKIVTVDEIYYIEPSWRHLPESKNYTMLAYKGSDLRRNSNEEFKRFCPGLHAPDGLTRSINFARDGNGYKAEGTQDIRKRRQAQPNNACHLYVAADYQFFSQIASNDETRAVNYMIDLVSRVDKIYRRTEWPNGLIDMGFTIKKVRVFKNSSCDKRSCKSSDPNCMDVGCTPQEFLDAFGEVTNKKEIYNNYCLAHLFTGYSFSNGVLGLAYIASPQQGALGGVCSNTYYNPTTQKDYYLNTGWSSAVNKAGTKILTQEAEIVLAHELGHNWGSEHDPATTDCSPSSSDGKYIMYTYAVSGFDSNNNYFSPCSKRSIGQVLSVKSRRCFQVRLDSMRGNYRVDPGEECDAGVAGNSCCGTDFKLRLPSNCSDTNDVCCTNCSIAKAIRKPCRGQSDLTCEANATCDGVSKTCPPKYSAAGSPCLPDRSGRCLSANSSSGAMHCTMFCEVLGMVTCSCSDVANSCYACCRLNRTAACLPYDKLTYRSMVKKCSNRECLSSQPTISIEPYNYLNDSGKIMLRSGTPCIVGYCNGAGVCVKESQDQLTRFWDFITHLTPSAVVQFMQDNVVGTIIVFSLVIWLPASIAVSCIDKKRERAEQEAEALSMPWTGTLTRVSRRPPSREVKL